MGVFFFTNEVVHNNVSKTLNPIHPFHLPIAEKKLPDKRELNVSSILYVFVCLLAIVAPTKTVPKFVVRDSRISIEIF